jgi:hypothetical protein
MQATRRQTPFPDLSGEADVCGMLSTLCLYDNWLGPYHPQTLYLLAQAGRACWQAGFCDYARPLLERAVRDMGRYLAPDTELRRRALSDLGDLLAAVGDYERSNAIRNELLRLESSIAILQ